MLAIAPSILAADFSRLGDLVRECESAGADRIHIDVMDGHFVPNLSMGPVVVQGLRPVTRLPLEVHLMIERPLDYVEPFLKAGANTLIFHHEVVRDPLFLVQRIRAAGAKVGIAINPSTSVDSLAPILSDIDLALCMTVVPGFGGQPFMAESVDRIAALRQLIARHNVNCELEVDGGIDETTARTSVRAGANVLVAGTSIFGASDGPTSAIRRLAALEM